MSPQTAAGCYARRFSVHPSRLAQSAPENTEKFTPLPGFDKSAMDMCTRIAVIEPEVLDEI